MQTKQMPRIARESAAPPVGAVLEARELTMRFGNHLAVANLNLAIGAGEIYCLLGPNGAGKTTTINLFLNFLEPTAGTVSIAGMDVTRHPIETKKHVAYIPENVMLYGNLTGLENLEYFSALTGRDRNTREELLAYLEDAGLQREAATRRVGSYSKGMRQKVGIAIAVAKGAAALLLDEPTSGLDPKAANEFSALLMQLSGRGVAVLMATHDLFCAKETGTRVGIMRHGALVAEMSTRELGHADLERVYLDHMREKGCM